MITLANCEEWINTVNKQSKVKFSQEQKDALAIQLYERIHCVWDDLWPMTLESHKNKDGDTVYVQCDEIKLTDFCAG